MHKRKTEEGFGVVTILLIIACLILIVGVGWYVKAKNKLNEQPLTTEQQIPDPALKPIALAKSNELIEYFAINDIAKTDDQKSILTAVKKMCEGMANYNYVAVNEKIFQENTLNIFYIENNHAKLNGHCVPFAKRLGEYEGSGRELLLHKDVNTNNWIIDSMEQQGPQCSAVDYKGYPATIVEYCYDGDDARKIL